jgi:hypothetical protein
MKYCVYAIKGPGKIAASPKVGAEDLNLALPVRDGSARTDDRTDAMAAL